MPTHGDPRTSTTWPPQGAHMIETGGNIPPITTGYEAAQTQSLMEYEDYFSYSQVHIFRLPDNLQWIQFKELNEGDIRRYHAMLRRDVVVEKRTGDARISLDQAEDRRALILAAVTGWNLVRRNASGEWKPVPFSSGTKGSELDKWLGVANPKLVLDLENAIRKANPYLMPSGPETLEEIDRQIEELVKQRAEIEAREMGEDYSASK